MTLHSSEVCEHVWSAQGEHIFICIKCGEPGFLVPKEDK